MSFYRSWSVNPINGFPASDISLWSRRGPRWGLCSIETQIAFPAVEYKYRFLPQRHLPIDNPD